MNIEKTDKERNYKRWNRNADSLGILGFVLTTHRFVFFNPWVVNGFSPKPLVNQWFFKIAVG